MDPNNQHFLVIGTVEDSDPAAFGKATRSPPEKIMFKLIGTGLLEAEHFAAFRIDTGHNVPDGSVLAGAVHSLKDQEQRIPMRSAVKILQRTQLLHVVVQDLLILLCRLAIGIDNRRPFAKINPFAWRHTIVLRSDRHAVSLETVSVSSVAAASEEPWGYPWLLVSVLRIRFQLGSICRACSLYRCGFFPGRKTTSLQTIRNHFR